MHKTTGGMVRNLQKKQNFPIAGNAERLKSNKWANKVEHFDSYTVSLAEHEVECLKELKRHEKMNI